jgi:hypothetical protein
MTIPYRSGINLTLVRSVQYRRLDGADDHLLEWRASNGRVAVSGLLGRGVIWTTADDHLASIEKARARQASAPT